MKFYPAIDILDGKCVRLSQGRYDAVTQYDADPVDALSRWIDQGASHVHIVNLGGARDGGLGFIETLRRLVQRAGSVKIQTGGGVRQLADIRTLVDTGAWRVVVGTMAVKNTAETQEACNLWPERVVVGVDAKNGEVATHGWTQGSGLTVNALLEAYAPFPVGAFLYTDIARDGMQHGLDLAGLSSACKKTKHGIIASGGVSTLDDLRVLRASDFAARIDGVIVGKALYEGNFSVADAIKVIES